MGRGRESRSRRGVSPRRSSAPADTRLRRQCFRRVLANQATRPVAPRAARLAGRIHDARHVDMGAQRLALARREVEIDERLSRRGADQVSGPRALASASMAGAGPDDHAPACPRVRVVDRARVRGIADRICLPPHVLALRGSSRFVPRRIPRRRQVRRRSGIRSRNRRLRACALRARGPDLRHHARGRARASRSVPRARPCSCPTAPTPRPTSALPEA